MSVLSGTLLLCDASSTSDHSIYDKLLRSMFEVCYNCILSYLSFLGAHASEFSNSDPATLMAIISIPTSEHRAP